MEMGKKKVVIVNSSDIFEYRINLMVDIFKKNGCQVKVVTSDFMHIEKKKRKQGKKDYYYIETVPYRKNISVQRLWSHCKFSIDAYKRIKNWKFDLLYLVVPPNSQAWIAKKYCSSDVKIIMDIIDLWPESLPTGYTDLFPFTLWAGIRNHNLKYADFVITECNMYRERLQKYLDNKKTETLYWVHKDSHAERRPCPDNANLSLCYLGSINNIIDIPAIGRIIKELAISRPVVLKIIGDGERRNELIETAEEAGAKVIFYGKIYDFQEKQNIFDTCHFGINIMKKQVCVGLSMKSIDYFEAGLPILNNLSGDTEKLVEKYSVGINLKDLKKCEDIWGLTWEEYRLKVRGVYEMLFSYQKFQRKFEEIVNSVLK